MTERITRLVLSRKPGESIQVGDVRIVVVSVSAQRARIAIEGPESVRIRRDELIEEDDK